MATCSPQTLLASNPAFLRVTIKPVQLAKLALLCQILKKFNPVATCDIPTLMARSKCFCAVTNDPAERIELQLLCEISGVAGSGSGFNQVSGYINNPNTEAVVPANPNLEAVAASPGKPIYTWTIPGGPWV